MEIRFSSTCSSPAADDVDFFVVLRVGESHKLAKLGCCKTFGIPESAANADGQINGRIDVLKCVASCNVALNAKADPLCLDLPCLSEPGLGNVHVQSSAHELGTGKLAGVRHTTEANDFLTEHGVQDSLAAAVREVLKTRPAEPRRFIAEFLLGGPTTDQSKPWQQPVESPSGKNQVTDEQQLRLSPSHGPKQVIDEQQLRLSPSHGPKQVTDELQLQCRRSLLPPLIDGADFDGFPSVGFDRQVSSDTLKGADVTVLANEIRKLRLRCDRTDDLLDDYHAHLSQLSRDQPLTFTVSQYNILAHYLGNNTEPWFLYGPDISEDRRQRIMKAHRARDERGNLLNKGWPNYVRGILTDHEIKQVEEINTSVFDWRVRRPRLLEMIARENSDIISLVELDEFADFEEALDKYGGVYRKRPRKNSRDGCCVFWRKTKFDLVNHEGFDFVDRTDKTGTALKDRTCLLVLLKFATARFGRHESRVIVVSTHLARNPEDASQTKVRARQAAQLMKHLTEFASRNHAEEVPVVLMGDLNAQHFGEIRGIARTVFQVCEHPCHSFLFQCADVPTGPTSMTDCRKVRIDTVMFPPKQLKVLGIHVAELKNKIPDALQPSDHVPVRVKFELKADHMRLRECALTWLACVTGATRLMPMTEADIRRAFTFFDRDGSGVITQENLRDSCLDCMEVGRVLAPDKQLKLLSCFTGQEINWDQFIDAYQIKFNVSRMANITDLERAFLFFDANNDGKVTADDVRSAFLEIVPIEFTEEEVEAMLEQMKVDWQDGVDVHKFCETMCSCNFSCSSEDFSNRVTKAQTLQHRLEETRFESKV